MNIIQAIAGTATETRLNPNVGTWSWFLHRLSGLFLTFYLLLHIIVIATSPGNAGAFDARLGAVQSPLFHLLDIGLVLVIFYHMLNGLRITIVDFFGLTRAHQKLLWGAMIILIVVMAYATATMLPKVFSSHSAAGQVEGGGH